jgi:hypothetical protein
LETEDEQAEDHPMSNHQLCCLLASVLMDWTGQCIKSNEYEVGIVGSDGRLNVVSSEVFEGKEEPREPDASTN